MKPRTRLLMPEGESGAGGGGAAVAEPPAGAPPATQNPGEFEGLSLGQALSKHFGNREPVTKAKPNVKPKPEPKSEPKSEAKPAETKPEVKEAPKAAETPRSSIFDPVPETKPETEAAKPESKSTVPGSNIPVGDWEAAHAARKKLHDEVNGLRMELGKYHEAIPDLGEVERLRREHKLFSEKVALLDYQSHPEFQSKFTEPKQKIAGDIQTILKDAGIEGFDLNVVTAKPRAEMAKDLSAIGEKLNDYDKGEFRLLFREYQKLSDGERGALANHQEGVKALREAAAAKQRTAFESRWKTTSFATFAQKLEPPKDFTPQEADEIRALNAGIDGIRPAAEKYAFAASDEAGAADIAIKAANYDFVTQFAFPRMQADYRKVMELNKQLAKKLEDLAAHKPGGNLDQGAAQGDDSKKDFNTELKKLFRS